MPRDSQYETLRDRFRGALLGLSLAPTNRCIGTDGPAQTMLKIVAPKLLRYHNCWECRWHWVQSNQAWAAANRAATVQALILGDLLDMALCDPANFGTSFSSSSQLSGFTHLEDGSMRYDLPTEQQRYYQRTLAEISHGRHLPSSTPSFGMTSTLGINALGDAAFVGGVVSALRHRESYGLAVQTAVEYGGAAPMLAGFLAGATGGLSSLPVLWQLREGSGLGDLGDLGDGVNGSKIVAQADGLFAQWSGQLVDQLMKL